MFLVLITVATLTYATSVILTCFTWKEEICSYGYPDLLFDNSHALSQLTLQRSVNNAIWCNSS